jgi:hypothetical protein
MKKEASRGGCWAALCKMLIIIRIIVLIVDHGTLSPLATPRSERVTRSMRDMLLITPCEVLW